MKNEDKSKRYNLYYIISESIEKENIPLKIYYDMLVYLLKKVETNQGGEIAEDNE